MSKALRLCVLVIVFCGSAAALGAQIPKPLHVRPYKVLVVVDHWQDPSSVVVERRDAFQPVVALLKAWSVPFDIFRLDQQFLDGTYLFARSGRIRYGVVIWLADPSSYPSQDLASLEDAVRQGTSVIFMHSRFLNPTLEKITGLHFKSIYTATDPFQVSHQGFITRGLTPLKLSTLSRLHHYSERMWVQPEGAQVLISQGRYPVLTIRRSVGGGSAIWMGLTSLGELHNPYWRTLFLRSLVWSMGYLVRPGVSYSKSYMLLEDDWGDMSKTFLTYWRYQEPGEQEIKEDLVAPLEQHHAVIGADICPGFLDRKTRRVVVPWKLKFTDRFGVLQNYRSTYRGLNDAIAAGVMEVESHGWTHMIPDLESPPGPWWDADPDGLGSADGWWQEFGDPLRKREVPAIAQRFYLTRSLHELIRDFNRRPLLEMVPGGSWSKSYANNSFRVAAHVGYGIYSINSAFVYMDQNLVVHLGAIAPGITDAYDRPFPEAQDLPPHPDGPLVILSHDRDISLSPNHDFMNRLFASLPAGYKNLAPNEYIGFLHTPIHSFSSSNAWDIAFAFDTPYTQYFAEHASIWQLWIAEPILAQMKPFPALSVSIDGKPGTRLTTRELDSGRLLIHVPAGRGSHVWRLTPGQ